MTKRIITVLLALMLCCFLVISVSASDYSDGFLYDEANLLTNAEAKKLEQILADISSTYDAQLVICTIPTTNGIGADFYLDYLYDTMGFGYGAQHDGVLLLICMDVREYRILSNGYAGIAIGKKAGTRLSGKAGILGGILLILIGLEIFITSWF